MKFLRASILALLLLLASCGSRPTYVQITGFAQGGPWYVTCSLDDAARAEGLKQAIDDTLSAIDWSVSGYNKGSLLTKVNNGENPPLDSIFIDLMNLSRRLWVETGGAFDVSGAPLFDLWGFGFKEGRMPSQQAVDSAMAVVGMDKYSMVEGPDGKTYLRMPTGGKVNFNAIAQGYSCDVVARVLDSWGSENYMVSLGGELVCKGLSARGDEWRVWIDRPQDGNNDSGVLKQDVITITDCSLVTSGNYRKFYVVDGVKYSHTIDPSTGRPVNHDLLSATVLAEDGATADALATALMVAGPEKGRKMASDWITRGRGVYLVYGSQDDMKVWHTPGLKLESGN
ncbi:MAG: FAD:protein FMN transferase [Bacteroidales bacterium]|nr:FAD:protein FMN transferase [Bacteroidales bacterium]